MGGLLEEELEHRDAPVEQVLEDDDVHPGLMVAVDQVPAPVLEAVDSGNVPVRALRQVHPAAVAGHPCRCQCVQYPVDHGAHGPERQQEFHNREHEEEAAPRERIEDQQRGRDEPAQRGRRNRSIVGRRQEYPAASGISLRQIE